MAHKYYHEDTEQRKEYFDKQFLRGVQDLSRNDGLTVNQILGNIKDLNSFKKILEVSWSSDASLLSYFRGMDDGELLEFFERPVVQNILNQEPEKVSQNIPLRVSQVDNKTKEYFKGVRKGSLAIGYKTEVKVMGKTQVRYRDSKGRFISVRN